MSDEATGLNAHEPTGAELVGAELAAGADEPTARSDELTDADLDEAAGGYLYQQGNWTIDSETGKVVSINSF